MIRAAAQQRRSLPCEDCHPALVQRIDGDLDRIKLLAAQGLWTEAAHVFRVLREACLARQPNTVDPFELPISDTTILPQTRNRLERIGCVYMGQLAHVPAADFERVGIGQVGLRQLTDVCRRYGIRLKTR
jgi:hypothetical protein